MSLPSYQEATTRLDPWVVIAPLLPIVILSKLCLVSKHFYKVFAPLLWLAPTKLLLRNTNPLDIYGRFARAVRKTRQNVRCFVTILDFRLLKNSEFSQYHEDGSPPIMIQISKGIFSKWIQSLAAAFPSLKFVIVDGLTGFHLDAIIPVEFGGDAQLTSSSKNFKAREYLRLDRDRGGVEGSDGPTSSLDIAFQEPESVLISPRPVLLSLSGCNQFDISIFFDHNDARNLLYLDISWTKIGSLSPSQWASFLHLKVLKLRGLQLKSQQLTPVLKELGIRLFSLDLRNNALNDDLIRTLLAHSFLPRLNQLMDFRNETSSQNRSPDGMTLSSQPVELDRYMEDAPAYRERSDVTGEQERVVSDGRAEWRSDDLDGALSHLLRYDQLRSIQSIHGLPLDSDSFAQHTGITHLFLSDNQFSSDALRNLLLGTNRLQALDFGSAFQSRHHLAGKNPNIRPICQPDVVKLLNLHHSPRLESLRVHHSVATHTPTLITIGEFHVSEFRRIQMSEEQYAPREMNLSPAQLLPDTNPRIRSLTLSNVPQKSSGLVIGRLLHFLHGASLQESLIAKAAPPDRRRGAQMLTGLRLLRLEFENIQKPDTHSTVGASVSGNADADVFMAESNKDFSFFDDAGSGASVMQEGSAVEKDFSFFDDEGSTSVVVRSPSVSSPIQDGKNNWGRSQLRDVRGEILAYRAKTKAAFEREKDRLSGERKPVALGAPHYYWTGQLELVP